MATEEQTQYDFYGKLDFSVFLARGQRLTIPNRTVSKLGFWLMREGTGLSGDVYFEINRVSNDSLIASKYWGVLGDANPTVAAYEEVTFDTPVLINEEVRIFVRVTGGTADNHLGVWGQSSDVKADEVYCRYRVAGSAWEVVAGYDLAYRYTYNAPPTVTTQVVKDVEGTTATGQGNITDLGDTSVTQHGHCWNTSTNPTTSNDKTENGSASATGAFTSAMTDLIPGTGYYVRAWVTNTGGTSYGANVYFVASLSKAGYIWMEGSNFRGFDENAIERKYVHTDDVSEYVDYGLSFYGVVSTYTDSTHFKVDTLAGKGAGHFIPVSGDPYEIYVLQADGAAPEGQHKPVLAYTTGDGTFQHDTFTTNNLAVGDIVLIIHPWLARMLDLYTDWKDGGRLDLLIDAIITDIASAVPEPPTAKSLQDILHKDTNYGFTKSTDALQAISDDIDQQHLNIHILFIIPEAVGSITADNIALRTELLKLGDVSTIIQGDALEFPAFGSYAVAVLGSSSGTAWTTSNLVDLKNILGLTLICVDKACAAYFEIGTDGGDAAAKTVIRAISEIEGTKMGEGDANHQSVTGIDAGNNTVTTSATYHTLDMSNANITETVFCTEANDPDGATAKEDVVLGIIRRIQNDGSIGVDEAGADIPATLGFAGFAYEGNKLTTLGKALFLLFCHMLIQLRIQEQSVETGGLVADLRKRIFGNMKGSFTNTAPLVEYIAGENSVGSKLPVGVSLADQHDELKGLIIAMGG